MNTINEEDKRKIDAIWDKMAREDWEAGSGFSGRPEGLSRVPIIHKNRIFEFAIAVRDAEVEKLRNDLDVALDLKAGNGPTALSRVVQERDTLKKQVEEMRTEREFELAYCFGLMASDGITIDRMAEATTSERWTKIKEEIKKLNQPLT